MTSTAERASGTENGAATVALVLGVMALVSAWTGWGGMALGLAAVVAGVVALARVRAGRATERTRPRIGLALGAVALVAGTVLELPAITTGVTYLHVNQVRTLDECMRQAQNEKEQHVCKSQHLDEYRARYPGRIDP